MPHRVSAISASAQSLAILQELGEVLELGILTLDRELVITGWNRWLVGASGIESSDVFGYRITDVFRELAGSQAEEAFRRALEGATTVWSQQFHGHLLPFPPPSGHERYGRMQQSARIMPALREGEIEGVVVLVHDVTERVSREEQLRRALQHAEVASQAKSDFLASMSHELRTPLSAIVGYVDLLAGEIVGPLEELQKNYLGRVKSAASHLISIIEEILTFSRVEAGKEVLHHEMLDATGLARAVEELFEPQVRRKGLTLTACVPAESVPLWTDQTKLRQILINLLGNAVKFTEAGRVTLEMVVSAERLTFRIEDTGPGIAAGDLNRIFDPFTQLDQSLKRAKGGTGLGLPVSLRLARLLGGDLAVESVLGKGTIFSLWVPRTMHEKPVLRDKLSASTGATQSS